MKKLLLIATYIFSGGFVYSQTEYSSFTSTGRGVATTFATDYHATSINPSNLGWKNPYNKKITMGYGEFAFSMYSEALSKDELRSEFKSLIRGEEGSDFTQAEKIEAAKSFADAGFAVNVDAGSLGFSFFNEKLGGIAFRVNDRFQWYSKLGPAASEMLFLGFNAPYFDSLQYFNGSDTVTIANRPDISEDSLKNVLLGFTNVPKMISEIMNGSVMQMSWTREYNFSYGRKILGDDSTFALYGGVGLKYIQGMAYLDVIAENGNLSAFSSITPAFDIDYGDAQMTNPSAVTQGSKKLPKPVGNGFGFDIGFNAVIGGKLKIGAAITNIGSMLWDGNVYSMQDTLVYDTDNAGLDNFNVLAQMNDFAGDNGLFKWEGEESRKVSLPTAYRFGASLKFAKIIEAGIDVIIPGNEVPGNYENAVIAFGGDVTPVKWIRFSTGFITGGNYDFQIPVGFTLIASDGRWEGGVASRDAITFFSQNGPNLSLSMGFLRWRF